MYMPTVIFSDENKTIKYSTDSEKAEALANHFENIHHLTHKSPSVMEQIVNNIYNSYNDNTPAMTFTEENSANFKDIKKQRYNTIHVQTLQDTFISTKELQEIIKTRNNIKSARYDKTSNFVLKKMPEKFIAILAIILNHMINLQYIPSAWKLGAITPIAKPNKDNIDSKLPTDNTIVRTQQTTRKNH